MPQLIPFLRSISLFFLDHPEFVEKESLQLNSFLLLYHLTCGQTIAAADISKDIVTVFATCNYAPDSLNPHYVVGAPSCDNKCSVYRYEQILFISIVT